MLIGTTIIDYILLLVILFR